MSFQAKLVLAIFSLFFALETEKSRIVTIHRPLVITQERKTPAFYVYQQAQQLQNKTKDTQWESSSSSKYLSSLSLKGVETSIQTVEMKFTKSEVIAWQAANTRSLASISQVIKNEIENLSPELDYNNDYRIGPLAQQTEEPTVLQNDKKWATIKGKFELIEGVGILDHYIELKRIEEGQTKEVGRIDLKGGSYSIDIESPRGFLLAQIKDAKGSLVGEDRERLINLQSRGPFLEGPFIRVGQPATIRANVSQPSSSNKKTANTKTALNFSADENKESSGDVSVSFFDNQNTLENFNAEFKNVSAHASTIARVFDPSRIYKNMTTIRHSGENAETPLFTNKWLAGTRQFIEDFKKLNVMSETMPVIIGRVMRDGKPVSGAEVFIETMPGTEAIYLDQFMIPNFNSNSTADSGYFMFVGVEIGNYQILARKQNVTIGAQMFIAEEDSVAFQNINTAEAIQSKIIKTFDAISGEAVDADIVSAAADESIESIGGVAQINTYATLSVVEYLVRTAPATDYEPIRYVTTESKDYVHVPMIKKSWLTRLKEYKMINELPNTGVFVGFTGELSYDVYLTEPNYNSSNVVYFDSNGNITQEAVVGGGFIMFNVPVGAQEVVLQERVSDRIHSQVLNILDQQISASHLKFE